MFKSWVCTSDCVNKLLLKRNWLSASCTKPSQVLVETCRRLRRIKPRSNNHMKRLEGVCAVISRGKK